MSTDLSGKLVFHKKAKCGNIELGLKPKYSYFSLCLGVCYAKEPPKVDDAKKCLMNFGWFSSDDLAEILGEKKAKAVLNKIVDKYEPLEIEETTDEPKPKRKRSKKT